MVGNKDRKVMEQMMLCISDLTVRTSVFLVGEMEATGGYELKRNIH